MHPHIHWRKKEIHFYFAGCGLPDLCDIHGKTRMPDLFKSVESSIKYTINAFQEEVLKNFFTVFTFLHFVHSCDHIGGFFHQYIFWKAVFFTTTRERTKFFFWFVLIRACQKTALFY